MKKIIQIPATFTVRTCLRIFFAKERVDTEVELDVSGCYRDFPVGRSQVATHGDVVRFIRGRLLKKPPGDESPGLWVKGVRMRALAYQMVETSTVAECRRAWGHPSPEPTVVTTKVLGKKVFLVGERISQARAKKLRSWVKAQRRLPRPNRDFNGFESREVSYYFSGAADRFLAGGRHRFGIKIGCATIVPLKAKKVALRPTGP